MHRKVKHRGRGDTVKQFNQRAHNEEKKNKGPRDKCEMENNKKEKIILETILERETKDKRKEDTSVSAQYQKMEVGCKQQIINRRSTSTLKHGWQLMYITSNSNRNTTTYILFNWKIAKCQ